MKDQFSKKFFIASFLPALAYWYLEARYPIRIAVLGGVVLAIVELGLEKILSGSWHPLSKFNFFLMLFLALISLLGDSGIWFKLNPAITGLVIGMYLWIRMRKGKGLLAEMSHAMNQKRPPLFFLDRLERDVAIFFFLYGIFMGILAFLSTTDVWAFFKTIGLYLIFFLFFIFEIIRIRMMGKKLFKARRF